MNIKYLTAKRATFEVNKDALDTFQLGTRCFGKSQGIVFDGRIRKVLPSAVTVMGDVSIPENILRRAHAYGKYRIFYSVSIDEGGW